MKGKKLLSLLLALVLCVGLIGSFAGEVAAEGTTPSSTGTLGPVTAELRVKQTFTWTNNHPPQYDKIVGYKLTPKAGQDGSVDKTEISLDGDEIDKFTFTMDHAGLYLYELKSVVDPSHELFEFYHYDLSVYTVEVHVRNQADGSLITAVVVKDKDGNKIEGGSDYDVEYDHVYDLIINTLYVKQDDILRKKLTGDKHAPDEKFRFIFRTVSMQGVPNEIDQPMPLASQTKTRMQVARTGPGWSNLGSLAFTEPGVYKYQLYERKGSSDVYTYDTSVYFITYTVTLDGADLSCERLITLDGKAKTAAIFTNKYTKPIPIVHPTPTPTTSPVPTETPTPTTTPVPTETPIPTESPVPTVEPTTEPTPAPTEEITEPKEPKASPDSAWALVNLIMSVLTVGVAGGTTYSYAKKKGEIEDEDEKKKLATKLLSWIPAAGSVVAFLLTEDMSAPMALVDKWTVLMGAILAANGATAYFTRAKKPENPADPT